MLPVAEVAIFECCDEEMSVGSDREGESGNSTGIYIPFREHKSNGRRVVANLSSTIVPHPARRFEFDTCCKPLHEITA